MPRKTRKAKEQAGKRRFVKREFQFSLDKLTSGSAKQKVVERADKSFSLSEASLTTRDLLKSVLFATSLFSLELVLYLFWFK